MQPSYTIRIDPARSLLYLKFVGVFGAGARARFIADRAAAIEELGCGRNKHFTLCDGSEIESLSEDAISDLRAATSDPVYASRRLAIITNAELLKMQARSIVRRQSVTIFNSGSAALAWLLPDVPKGYSPAALPLAKGAMVQRWAPYRDVESAA